MLNKTCFYGETEKISPELSSNIFFWFWVIWCLIAQSTLLWSCWAAQSPRKLCGLVGIQMCGPWQGHYSCTIVSGTSCTIVSGTSCIIVSGTSCTIVSGISCTIVSDTSCTIVSGTSCTIASGTSCTIVSGTSCTIVSGTSCTIVSGKYSCLTSPLV